MWGNLVKIPKQWLTLYHGSPIDLAVNAEFVIRQRDTASTEVKCKNCRLLRANKHRYKRQAALKDMVETLDKKREYRTPGAPQRGIAGEFYELTVLGKQIGMYLMNVAIKRCRSLEQQGRPL